MRSLSTIRNEISACTLCPQRVTANKKARSLGSKQAEVFVVLPHPTMDDDRAGLIGMGFEGQFLLNHLKLLGLGPQKVYLTSLIKCFPGWQKGFGYRKVSTQAMDTCPPAYLMDELIEVNPKLIVTCGADVTRYFGIKGGINKNSGRIHDTEYGPVMPLTHPSSLMAEMRKIPIFVTQLRLISAFLAGNLKEPPPYDPEGWSLDVGSIYGMDIETIRPEGDLDWNHGTIHCIGFADEQGRVTRSAKKDLTPGPVSGRPSFHNSMFDVEHMEREGWSFPEGWHDSILSSHLLGLRPLGLKALTPIYTGVNMTEFKEIDYENEEQTFDYCATDSWAGGELSRQQLPELERRGLMPLYETEIKFGPVLRKMELNGLPVDQDRVSALRVTLQEEVLAAADFLDSTHEFTDPFNDREFAAWFWQGREGGAPRTGKAKELSCNKDDLLKVKSHIEEGEWPYIHLLPEQERIVKARVAGASASKFIVTYLDKWTGDRIYPSFNQTGTQSWRLSSAKPNIQNVPKKGSGGRLYHCIVAPEGRMLVSADYAALELRNMANRAGPGALRQVFVDGRDLHDERVKKLAHWFALKGITKSEDKRRYAKVINFGIPYGLTGYGAAKRLSLTKEEGELLIDGFFEDYPEVKAEQKRSEAFARRHGYVETFLGRPMYIPGIYAPKGRVAHHAMNQAWSYPPQGDGMEIVKAAMMRLHYDGLLEEFDVMMIVQVHDELLFELDENKAEAFAERLAEVLRDERHEIPYIAEPHIGRTWGEIKDTEDPFHSGDDDAEGV